MPIKKVLVSGATGLVGTHLISRLSAGGTQVSRLVRMQSQESPTDIFWDPMRRRLDSARLEGFDAVVHLAGENIADGRWSAAKKERIRRSRSDSTRFLVEVLSRLNASPRVLVAASAIGYYGDRGEEFLNESSPPGQLFLSDVCKEWEAATEPAAQKGIRVVNLRLGVVLSQEGGALPKMITPFKMGVGGKLGSGQQYMSWVSLDDVIGVIEHVLAIDSIRGPVNTVAPAPVTNAAFTKALGRALHRPTVLPMPAWAAKLVFGQMADELLLASARVEPAVLKKSGYVFKHPDIDMAIQDLLK